MEEVSIPKGLDLLYQQAVEVKEGSTEPYEVKLAVVVASVVRVVKVMYEDLHGLPHEGKSRMLVSNLSETTVKEWEEGLAKINEVLRGVEGERTEEEE